MGRLRRYPAVLPSFFVKSLLNDQDIRYRANDSRHPGRNQCAPRSRRCPSKRRTAGFDRPSSRSSRSDASWKWPPRNPWRAIGKRIEKLIAAGVISSDIASAKSENSGKRTQTDGKAGEAQAADPVTLSKFHSISNGFSGIDSKTPTLSASSIPSNLFGFPAKLTRDDFSPPPTGSRREFGSIQTNFLFSGA